MQNSNPALSGNIIATFFYYVAPSIIGLIAITTANLVDGIFVGNAVGANALAAITLLIPYFTLLIAVALMIAIGGAVSAGKSIGEDDTKTASDIFSQSLIATVFITLGFALLSLGFEQQLYSLLNIPQTLAPLVSEYFNVIRWVLIIQLLTMVLYYFVRADGHPVLATFALVSGALINIALDAWFILYLDMGLKGAAYATAIAQIVQLSLLSYYFISPKKTLCFSFWQNTWSRLFYSAYNGVSEFVNEISAGLIFLLLNNLLISRLGVNGVAAFTVANYFIFLSIMLCYGIADALHLVVSQNFGARNFKRIRQFLLTALCSSFLLGGIIITILLLWQNNAVSWFLDEKDTDIAAMTSQLLLLIWPLFLVNGINILLSCYLTAIHQPRPSALIAIARGLVLPASLLVSLYFLLPQWLITTDREWAFLIALPVAEWSAFLLAAFLCYQYRPSSLPGLQQH